MEHLVEQPSREQLRSFDILASIDMMRYDRQMFGQVLPETRQRILDEELSALAEGADRASRTSFTLTRGEDGDLQYFNNGQWTPYMSMLYGGLEVAKAERTIDSRREFLADWAANDVLMGYKMKQLKPGERLSWSNGFPHTIAARYGSAFMTECGLKPGRQMGFLYQAVCHHDGSVELQSQTVDRSDADAFAAAERSTQYDSDLDMDGMLRAYDGTLRQKHGGHFYAGSRQYEQAENAWQTVLAQKDLIDYFMTQLDQLSQATVDREQLRTLAARNLYGVWALFKRRLDGEMPQYSNAPGNYHQIHQDVTQSFQLFAASQEYMVFCGAVIKAGDITQMSPDDAFDAIFGENGKPETYTFSKLMFCVVCQAPPEKQAAKKMCGPCGICKGCDTKIQRSNAASSFSLAK